MKTEMKTKIRKGTFETNSSSSHSFTTSGDVSQAIGSLPITSEGKIVIMPTTEYGWGYEEYSDPLEKVKYVAKDIHETGDEGLMSKLIQIIANHHMIPEENVIIEIDESDYYASGYIDHQSIGVGSGILYNDDDQTIIETLFSHNSVLVIDNDNH